MGIGDNFLFVFPYTAAINDGYIFYTNKSQYVMNVVRDKINFTA